jgi:hypothetical protein
MIGQTAKVFLGEVDREIMPRCPICGCPLRFKQADCCDAVSRGHFRPESGNSVGSRGIQQLVAGNLFLTGKFLNDQFPRDLQRSPR